LNAENHIAGVQYFEPLQQDHIAFNILKSTLAWSTGIKLPLLSNFGLMSKALHERKTWPPGQELNCHGFQTVVLMGKGKKFTVCSGQSTEYDFSLQPGGCNTCFQIRT
jgi:hypothetical protein